MQPIPPYVRKRNFIILTGRANDPQWGMAYEAGGYLDPRENAKGDARVAALAGRKDQLDEPTRAAWQAADTLVNNPPKPLQANLSALTANVDGKMLADFRAQVADLLLKFTNER